MSAPLFRVVSRLDLKIATEGFKDEQRIGAGPRGEVYRGNLGATSVAIKVHLADEAEKVDGGPRQYLTNLITKGPPKHPNIVPIIGAALDGGSCTISPLILGGSLETRLRDLNWYQRLKVASGAFDGLEALHNANIMHGNLKASNILLAPDGLTGMLADVWPTPPPTDGLEPSVANYYDPEYLSSGLAKPTADIYSMGVILLEMLTSKAGQVPKLNETEEAALAESSASADPMEALQVAAVKAGWPAEVAQEVVALAAACVRPHADRRKAASVIAKALREVIEEEIEVAGGEEVLLQQLKEEAERNKMKVEDVEGEEAGSSSKNVEGGAEEGLPNFGGMSDAEREEYDKAALKLQAVQRGRAARAKVKQLREEGASKEDVAKAQKEEEEAMAMFKGTAEEQAAATKLQAVQRGKMARKRVQQMKGGGGGEGEGEGGAAAAAGGDDAAAGTSAAAAEEEEAFADSGPTEEEKEAAEAEILRAEIFGRLVAMLNEQDSEVQRVGALALSVYTNNDACPDAHGSAEAAVSAGALAPLVSVFSSDNAKAVAEAAAALETISIELPEEQDRAQRAGALDACLRLIGTDQEPALRVAGAKALRGLLLQNKANCREVMDKGGLDKLLNLQEQPEAGCQSAASLALSSLADADTEILQALGVETLVGMAVRAKDPATRAGTIAFVSKLARDSDTHEQIRSAGGLDLLVGMLLRFNEEAVWGLASMASVEDNWDDINQAMAGDGFEALKDLAELGGPYGKEGAAWATCYMAGDVRMQVQLVRANVLPGLVTMVKEGTRRCRKAAERALKALASTAAR